MVNAADLGTHLDRFIRSGAYLRNWSPRTIRTHKQGLQALSACGRAKTTGPATSARISFQGRHRELHALTPRRGLSPAGCNVHLRRLNSFLSWLHEEGLMDVRLRAKLLQHPRDPPVVFSDADVRLIIRHSPRAGSRVVWQAVCALASRRAERISAVTPERRVDTAVLHF